MEFSRILRQPTTSEFFHNRKIIKIHNENISLCEIAISYVFCAFHIFYVVSDLNINIDSRKVFLNKNMDKNYENHLLKQFYEKISFKFAIKWEKFAK